MKRIQINYIVFLLALLLSTNLCAQKIPLPEHPRPDFQRENWINLNGTWEFQFDSLDVGMEKGWFNASYFRREDHRALPLGIKTLRCRKPCTYSLVQPQTRYSGRLVRKENLPGNRCM